MSPRYIVLLRPAAQRDWDHLPAVTYQRVQAALLKLEENPRPRGSKKLTGRENEWRLRMGEYRVLYEVDDKARVVRVFCIRHRREAYR
jgi:mRNA interferase RelE/StbE